VFDAKKFNLKVLNEVEGGQQYQHNRVAALENLYYSADKRDW
jgi:hypothetical protein